MPSINDFVGKKNAKKGSEWSLPTISKPAATPQRRPGRGEDAPLQTEERDTERQIEQTPTALSATSGATKPTTKLQQTRNKPTTEPATNLQQTYSKATTTEDGANGEKKESYNKLPTQPTTEPTTNLQQTSTKVTTVAAFLSLVGLQRRIVLFLYELCRSQGERVTEAVSISNVAASCETTVRAAQETIRRLEVKGFIRRIGYKNGRGGWTTYELPEGVYKELFQLESSNKLTPKLQQTPNKLPAELTTQPTTGGPSSSSSIDLENFKTTTTGEPELFDDARVQLSPDWAAVDFSPLAEVGFSRAHLIQLARHGKLSTSEVQDAIHFFAFDLKRNGKGKEIKGPPVNFFMGILRKGLPYAPPENYESPEAEARRRYLEGKRRLEEQREAEERELEALEFSEWVRGLSREEINAIVPDVVRFVPKAEEASLKAHFHDNVWSLRRAAIPGAIGRERAEIGKQINESLGQGSA